jgi:hypothetical protein
MFRNELKTLYLFYKNFIKKDNRLNIGEYARKNFLINLQFFLKNNRLNKGECARKNGYRNKKYNKR